MRLVPEQAWANAGWFDPTCTVEGWYDKSLTSGPAWTVTQIPGAAGQGVTTLSLTLPAGLLGGDYIVLRFGCNQNTTISMTTGSGYTTLVDKQSTAASSVVFGKIAPGTLGSASSDAGATITVTYGTSGRVSGLGMTVGSADQTTQLDATIVSNTPSSGVTSYTYGPITTATDAALLIVTASAQNTGTTQSWTAPAGFANAQFVGSTAASASNSSCVMAARVTLAAGSYGSYTDTWSVATNAANDADLIAIRPVTASTSTPISASDSGSGADTVTAVDAAISASDTGTGADTGTVAAALSAADTGSGADTASLAAALSAADTGSGADNASLGAALAAGDTGATADTVGVAAALTAADSGSGADSSDLAAAISAADTGTGVDSMSVDTGGSANKDLADTGAAVDDLTVQVLLAADDAGTLADLLSVPDAVPPVTGGGGRTVISAVPKLPPRLRDQDVDLDPETVGVFELLTVEITDHRPRREAEMIALDLI